MPASTGAECFKLLYQDAVSVLQVLFPHLEEKTIIESHTFVYVHVVQEQDTGKRCSKSFERSGCYTMLAH